MSSFYMNGSSLFATDEHCYDVDLHQSASPSSSWESYFYYGGPGFNQNCLYTYAD